VETGDPTGGSIEADPLPPGSAYGGRHWQGGLALLSSAEDGNGGLSLIGLEVGGGRHIETDVVEGEAGSTDATTDLHAGEGDGGTRPKVWFQGDGMRSQDSDSRLELNLFNWVHSINPLENPVRNPNDVHLCRQHCGLTGVLVEEYKRDSHGCMICLLHHNPAIARERVVVHGEMEPEEGRAEGHSSSINSRIGIIELSGGGGERSDPSAGSHGGHT
jgi:hypothetical protein